MKNVKQINQYLSSLAVLNIKLHNLHWNVTGNQFKQIHDFTEELYDENFENFDAVAERLKIVGQEPLVKLSDYLANSIIEEIDNKDFSPSEVVSILTADFKALRNLAVEIRNTADEDDDFVTVAQFEDYVEALDKNLWFLDAMSK